jgi:hypothetical protein
MIVDNDRRQSSQRIACIFLLIEHMVLQVKFSSAAAAIPTEQGSVWKRFAHFLFELS